MLGKGSLQDRAESVLFLFGILLNKLDNRICGDCGHSILYLLVLAFAFKRSSTQSFSK